MCRFVCHFVLVFFSPFSIAITSLGEERAGLGAFRTFVRFVLVWICRFPLPLGVWKGLRFVIMALPGLFSYLLLELPDAQKSSCAQFYCCFIWKKGMFLSKLTCAEKTSNMKHFTET